MIEHKINSYLCSYVLMFLTCHLGKLRLKPCLHVALRGVVRTGNCDYFYGLNNLMKNDGYYFRCYCGEEIGQAI